MEPAQRDRKAPATLLELLRPVNLPGVSEAHAEALGIGCVEWGR